MAKQILVVVTVPRHPIARLNDMEANKVKPDRCSAPDVVHQLQSTSGAAPVVVPAKAGIHLVDRQASDLTQHYNSINAKTPIITQQFHKETINA